MKSASCSSEERLGFWGNWCPAWIETRIELAEVGSLSCRPPLRAVHFSGTINYEIVCSLGNRLPRIYKNSV